MSGATEPAARLELRAIAKDFPGVRALDDVSFTLRAGEIHALCGENGAGKSTLLKVLSGVHAAGSYRGEVRIDGAPVALHGVRDAETHGIALIAQELALVPELTVAENLVLGREPVRGGLIDRAAMHAIAREALAQVGLDVAPEQSVLPLGIGQRQLIEIARALAKHALVLVLDEPTAALPERDAALLLQRLRELRDRGVAILYVSHRLDEVFAIADRITVLRDGRTVGSGAAAEMPRERVIALMVGREVAEHAAAAPRAPGAALLSVEHWSLSDPQQTARRVLDDVSFTLHAGEVLGIAGLMGAGRTALLTSLFGGARSSVSGRLALGDGAPRGPFTSPDEARRAGLALVSEDRRRYGLVPESSVEDNLALADLARWARRGLLDTRARARACGAQAAALQLRPPALDTLVARLSGGNQQKVVLGRWLLTEPRVLLLDEPTRGIDVGARAEIAQWIATLTARGMGVLLVSSDLPELLALSHRLLVLHQGRVTARLEAHEADARRVMRAATGLLAEVA